MSKRGRSLPEASATSLGVAARELLRVSRAAIGVALAGRGNLEALLLSHLSWDPQGTEAASGVGAGGLPPVLPPPADTCASLSNSLTRQPLDLLPARVLQVRALPPALLAQVPNGILGIAAPPGVGATMHTVQTEPGALPLSSA